MKKILNFVFPVLMIVFGVIAIVGGAEKLSSKKAYDASATAVIVGIERTWTGTDTEGFDEYEYHVYVNYEVDGKKYENMEYPGYSSSMNKGDEIEIVYESAHPENFAEKNITGNAVIFIIVGIVLILGGVFVGIKAFLRPA